MTLPKNNLLVLLNKNEEIALGYLLPKIAVGEFKEIICIDGGSTDRSVELLRSYKFHVLPQNSGGRGEAFKQAVTYAKTKGFDYIIFFSTDGNEDPKDLSKINEYTNQSPDLIIASRMLPGAHNEEDSKILRPRKWGNIFFAVIAWIIFGSFRVPYISDPINGYRALKVKTWAPVKFRSQNFSIEFETSITAYKKKFKVLEFPTHEHERLGGESSAKAFRTSFDCLKILFSQMGAH